MITEKRDQIVNNIVKDLLVEQELRSLLNENPMCWDRIQRIAIEAALIRYHGNRTHAARSLKMSVRGLRMKCHRLEIMLKKEDFIHEEETQGL